MPRLPIAWGVLGVVIAWIAASQAVATLQELLKPEHEPSVRLNAAKAILASLGPISEANELRARIDAIENQTALRVAR